MLWNSYLELGSIPLDSNPEIKDTYSVTSDIISFQLCPRQYGFFAVRKYQAAHVVQIWFGMVIHQVLDKLHLHYSGLITKETRGKIPTDEEVEFYFNEVEESLRVNGIKAGSFERDAALNILTIFNQLEGPSLYPTVKDSECSLQSDHGDYIIHGIVDILKDVSIEKNIPNYDSVEIWDYKGSKLPDVKTPEGSRKLRRYIFQMLVYANLYKMKYGKYPLKGVLYFMNELNKTPVPTSRPDKAIYEIDFRKQQYIEQIELAMQSFSNTVENIATCKISDSWLAPKEIPDNETCDICDLRWSCTTVKDKYPMRYP